MTRLQNYSNHVTVTEINHLKFVINDLLSKNLVVQYCFELSNLIFFFFFFLILNAFSKLALRYTDHQKVSLALKKLAKYTLIVHFEHKKLPSL